MQVSRRRPPQTDFSQANSTTVKQKKIAWFHTNYIDLALLVYHVFPTALLTGTSGKTFTNGIFSNLVATALLYNNTSL